MWSQPEFEERVRRLIFCCCVWEAARPPVRVVPPFPEANAGCKALIRERETGAGSLRARWVGLDWRVCACHLTGVLERARERVQERMAVPMGKRYFKFTALDDIVNGAAYRSSLTEAEREAEAAQRAALLDFLKGVMALDPARRWTPRQAAAHPFVTGAPFVGRFEPPYDPLQVGCGCVGCVCVLAYRE